MDDTALRIDRVRSRADFRRFVTLPRELYRSHPQWCPPLWMDEGRNYDPRHNPVLRESDSALFLAWRGRRPVGRVLAYVHHVWNAHYGTTSGLFGAFEAAEDDPEAGRALLDAAGNWLRDEGCNEMIGPLHPVDEVWGTLMEGFEQPAIFLTPWNPPSHAALYESAGFQGFKDLLAWTIDDREGGYVPNPRYAAFAARFLERHPDYRLRPLNTRRILDDATWIWRISNASLSRNWGFLPAGHAALMDNFRRMAPLADPNLIQFVEYRGRPVAFILGFADFNRTLRPIGGRLLPFGWLRLARDLSTIRQARYIRLFGLAVDPRHQGKGLDALLYLRLMEALKPRRVRLEANWVLEENRAMNTALKRLGMEQTARYRIWRRTLTPPTD